MPDSLHNIAAAFYCEASCPIKLECRRGSQTDHLFYRFEVSNFDFVSICVYFLEGFD